MNWDSEIFLNYTLKIRNELLDRGIKIQEKYTNEIYNFCMSLELNLPDKVHHENYPEHNERYLKQCYFNLQEKYDRRNYNSR